MFLRFPKPSFHSTALRVPARLFQTFLKCPYFNMLSRCLMILAAIGLVTLIEAKDGIMLMPGFSPRFYLGEPPGSDLWRRQSGQCPSNSHSCTFTPLTQHTVPVLRSQVSGSLAHFGGSALFIVDGLKGHKNLGCFLRRNYLLLVMR